MPADPAEGYVTECPSCHTRFRVSHRQLERARGRVRCGACLAVFDGLDHLILDTAGFASEDHARQALDDLLDELAADAPVQERSAEFPAIDGPNAGDDQPDWDEFGLAEPEPAPAPAPPPPAPAQPPPEPAPAEPEPTAVAPAAGNRVFGDQRDPRPRVWIAIAAGTALLIAQILWYQFDDWSTQPGWRAVYAPLCAVFGCELPVQRDVEQLTTRNLAVRSHPDLPDVLRVDAVIVNRAEFSQPFPALELQFTTVRGNLVAARRFDPEEYLAGDAVGMALMPPRTPVQIELNIDDPGPDAVNYFLRFR